MPHPCPEHSTYANPVINQDFPDPNCIKVKDTYYAFATNFGELQASSNHVQVAASEDLVHWRLLPDALPNLPAWAKPGKTWAPNVTHAQSKAGSYVLFFVAWDTASDLQALGMATSKNPEGPYECSANRPFYLQVRQRHCCHSNFCVHSCCTLSDVLHMQVQCQTVQPAVSALCIVEICVFVYHSQSITVLGHMDANRASVGPWVILTSPRVNLRCAQSANLPVHIATGL